MRVFASGLGAVDPRTQGQPASPMSTPLVTAAVGPVLSVHERGPAQDGHCEGPAPQAWDGGGRLPRELGCVGAIVVADHEAKGVLF